MKWAVRYVLVILPAVVTVGWWQWAVWAYHFYGCTGGMKNLQPCFVDVTNIVRAVGMGMFFGQMLSFFTVPIAVLMLIEVGARHIGSYRPRAGTPENTPEPD